MSRRKRKNETSEDSEYSSEEDPYLRLKNRVDVENRASNDSFVVGDHNYEYTSRKRKNTSRIDQYMGMPEQKRRKDGNTKIVDYIQLLEGDEDNEWMDEESSESMELDTVEPIQPRVAPAPDFTPEERNLINKEGYTGDNFHKAVASGYVASNDTSSLTIMPPVNDDGSLHLYCYEIEESLKKNGELFLFGKIWDEEQQGFKSCTVVLGDMNRDLYIVPSNVANKNDNNLGLQKGEDISEEWEGHFFQEFNRIKKANHLKRVKAKMVMRNYCFERNDVPRGVSKFVKFTYSYKQKPLLKKYLKGTTYNHIFGSDTSALENFIINKNIMGPCWLTLKNVFRQSSKVTWSRYECGVNYKDISISSYSENTPPVPPFVVMSLKICTRLHKNKNEILAVSAIFKNDVDTEGIAPLDNLDNFSIIRKLPEKAWPDDIKTAIEATQKPILVEPNENVLLRQLLTYIYDIDPDMIVGHNFLGYDLDVLLHRMKALKVNGWSRLGRLRNRTIPQLQSGAGGVGRVTWGEKRAMAGRLVCDTYVLCSSKEFIKEKNYKLSTLAKNQLNTIRHELDPNSIVGMYNDSDDIIRLCDHISNDAYLSLSLAFKLEMISMTKRLTQYSGCRWSISLASQKSLRIDYLLMHSFKNQETPYILPDRKPFATGKRVKRAFYKGGKVLEPKQGFYDTFILLLDYNSLYPSLIREYNICHSTVPQIMLEDGTYEFATVPDDSIEGILPAVVKNLLDRRSAEKRLMKEAKDADKKSLHNNKQLCLKLICNSVYGCLGAQFSRFYALPIARLITEKGREALEYASEIATEMNYNVVYGDTDSIMVETGIKDNLRSAKNIAQEIKKTINKHFSKLELDIDGIFQNMLLLRKKKYASLVIHEDSQGRISKSKEIKGLDMVRRDWCSISSEAGEYVLDQLFSGEETESIVMAIHEYLKNLSEDIKMNKLPISKFIITKGLTKNIEEYSENSQPHVVVAKKMREANITVQRGDHIPYVIIKDPTCKQVALRARHPKVVEEDGLEIDYRWYLAFQIHPAISRLVAPIEGTDHALIATYLGIDPASMVVEFDPVDATDVFMPLESNYNPETKYSNVKHIYVTCPSCSEKQLFEGVWTKNEHAADMFSMGLHCKECKYVFEDEFLKNNVAVSLRREVAEYYKGWCICRSCSAKTRKLFFKGNRLQAKCNEQGCRGNLVLQYPSKVLYTQMQYYCDLFDWKKEIYRSAPEILSEKKFLAEREAETRSFEYIHQYTKSLIEKNAYASINTGPLFSFFNNIV
eukprot:TRINITY_DN10603_c0_g1_i1.p1 TRINITY_DN10603_c0_g1~~TRINITY_DN10603_c0_g1_i1.p1  ORF type:complete len:1271 (+),score=266.22 TRINITY_DN10603_c0_g1_i1:39-3851(+)